MAKITITRIEFQNNRQKSYNLYENDTFLTEIREDTLVHFSIFKDRSFSKEQFDHILEQDSINVCLAQCYNYLQRRPYLRKELQRKLLNKQFSKLIIEKTFHRLEKNNYINDEDYITMFIRDAVRQGKSGPRLIQKKLMEKGASMPDIEKNMEELYPLAEQLEIANKLLSKKNSLLTEKSPLKTKQKLQQYGMSKGFSWPVLEKIIQNLPFSE